MGRYTYNSWLEPLQCLTARQPAHKPALRLINPNSSSSANSFLLMEQQPPSLVSSDPPYEAGDRARIPIESMSYGWWLWWKSQKRSRKLSAYASSIYAASFGVIYDGNRNAPFWTIHKNEIVSRIPFYAFACYWLSWWGRFRGSREGSWMKTEYYCKPLYLSYL